ncbi:MAG: hypothetical protein SGPRY_002051 [Prymnesium sp.]
MEEADVLKALVCSDIHLGLHEKDPIRGDDSFNTLEEVEPPSTPTPHPHHRNRAQRARDARVFTIASEQEVDFVLITGNLFHDNKPSRKAMKHAVETLRNHCLGDREVKLEIVSDQSRTYGHANYEDPNYNVQLPVFVIHGDHDDPGGEGGLSALDILSSANLINYFGKSSSSQNVSLSPVLIQKGRTKLALYGYVLVESLVCRLGHVRDEDLSTALDHGKIGKPADECNDWFNLLALHQKRSKAVSGAAVANAKSIHEKAIPHKPVAMDLVIWGHEHECQIGGGMDSVEEKADYSFVVLQVIVRVDFVVMVWRNVLQLKCGKLGDAYTSTFHLTKFSCRTRSRVTQPGSTVATDLTELESRPKHVAIIQLHKTLWKMSSVPLRTGLMDFLEEQIKEMIEEVKERQASAPPAGQTENLQSYPLLRLRVDYTGYSTYYALSQTVGNAVGNIVGCILGYALRYSLAFGFYAPSTIRVPPEQVANPSELLQFSRKVKKTAEEKADDKASSSHTLPLTSISLRLVRWVGVLRQAVHRNTLLRQYVYGSTLLRQGEFVSIQIRQDACHSARTWFRKGVRGSALPRSGRVPTHVIKALAVQCVRLVGCSACLHRFGLIVVSVRMEAKKANPKTSEQPSADGVPAQIQELVGEFLSNDKKQLRILPEDVLHKVVFEDFVGREMKTAIAEKITGWLERQQKELVNELPEAVGGSSKEQELTIETLVRDRASRAAAEGGATVASCGDAGASGGVQASVMLMYTVAITR